jgi:hypothetical protein
MLIILRRNTFPIVTEELFTEPREFSINSWLIFIHSKVSVVKRGGSEGKERPLQGSRI